MTAAEFNRLGLSVKKSKYGNKRTEYNGQIYDSKAEAEYAKGLDNCRSATFARERVVEYRTQVDYPCKVGGKHICTYIADFVVRYADERIEVVDVKSKATMTPVYKIKKKLVESLYGVKIIEIM